MARFWANAVIAYVLVGTVVCAVAALAWVGWMAYQATRQSIVLAILCTSVSLGIASVVVIIVVVRRSMKTDGRGEAGTDDDEEQVP